MDAGDGDVPGIFHTSSPYIDGSKQTCPTVDQMGGFAYPVLACGPHSMPRIQSWPFQQWEIQPLQPVNQRDVPLRPQNCQTASGGARKVDELIPPGAPSSARQMRPSGELRDPNKRGRWCFRHTPRGSLIEAEQ